MSRPRIGKRMRELLEALDEAEKPVTISQAVYSMKRWEKFLGMRWDQTVEHKKTGRVLSHYEFHRLLWATYSRAMRQLRTWGYVEGHITPKARCLPCAAAPPKNLV